MSQLSTSKPITPNKPNSSNKKRKTPSSSINTSIGSKSSAIISNKSTSSTVSASVLDSSFLRIEPSTIKNKIKRNEVYKKQKAEKSKLKSKLKSNRKKSAESLGAEAAVPAKKQKTLDNTKELDDTIVAADDLEIKSDELQDEFSEYFNGDLEPKIVITSCYKPSKLMYALIKDLLHVFPNSFYYARQRYSIKSIVAACSSKGFTDLLIINEDRKEFNALTHIHLPTGPTAYYKLSSVKLCSDILGHGTPTEHRPEVILNNFATRLGHRVGRMLGALFHQAPEFRGRRVATFHNQRDFIFFRHHRYIFSGGAGGDSTNNKARLQELGPRFTLKLQWLQHGTFDTQHGEFEWVHKSEMDTSRRRFFL